MNKKNKKTKTYSKSKAENIQTKGQKDQKNKKNGTATKTQKSSKQKNNDNAFVMWVIAVVALGIIIFFVARAAISSYNSAPTPEDVLLDNLDQENAFTYNGFPFVKEDNTWKTQIEIDGQVFDILREYSPRELENIQIDYQPNSFSELLKKQRRVYFAFDPDAPGASYAATVGISMARSLKEVYGVAMIPACTVNLTVCQGRPIVDCNSTESAVIQVTPESQTSITYRKNCLDIRGSETELIKAGDKVIYGWYGIME